MKRVLLTGASGFIGSHCLPLLVERGFEVHAVVPEGVESAASAAHWHVADLLDPHQVEGLLERVRPTHLLHLAWFVAPGEYWRSAENMRWLEAGLVLAKSFADTGGRRSVMAGTCAEYASSTEALIEHVTPIRPTTLYGACKAALHLASAAYFGECEISHAWGHVFYLYGPRENASRLVPSAIRALSAGERFVCHHPHDVRDFLHVEDVAGAFVALLGSEVEGDVNIASGEPVTVETLLETVAETIGRPQLVACEPTASERSVVVGDSGRLRREVGYVPRFDQTEGVEATVRWWREQSQLGSRIEGANSSE